MELKEFKEKLQAYLQKKLDFAVRENQNAGANLWYEDVEYWNAVITTLENIACDLDLEITETID